MELKEKLCKGIGKANGVKGCGVKTKFRNHGLCMKCYPDFILNTDAGKLIMQKSIIKAKVSVKQNQKAKDKVMKDKLKTLGQYEAEAKIVFQKFIRLRDHKLSCISCNETNAKEWHGSHYFDANRFSGLIFDERNVHRSCDYCNVFLHGNITGYRKGLIQRFGKEFVECLESESDSKRVYKYTKQELIEIKNKYLKKIKEISLS